jgi:hypothetical protein
MGVYRSLAVLLGLSMNLIGLKRHVREALRQENQAEGDVAAPRCSNGGHRIAEHCARVRK